MVHRFDLTQTRRTGPPEGAMLVVEQPQEPRAKRLRLAAELRRLREMAGVSGRELAQRINISQSKISRIESGMTTPPVPAVTAWAGAVGGDAETRAAPTALAEGGVTGS